MRTFTMNSTIEYAEMNATIRKGERKSVRLYVLYFYVVRAHPQ